MSQRCEIKRAQIFEVLELREQVLQLIEPRRVVLKHLCANSAKEMWELFLNNLLLNVINNSE